jgi:integrase
MEALSKPELLALLRTARAAKERDWCMILVAYWHGLRASEVIGIRPDDVKDGFLTVERLKGSMRTVQHLVEHPEPLLSERDALIEFAARTRFNQPLFKVTRQHFWRLVQRYGRAAGIPEHKCHPHALKHSIAMQMIDKAGIHKTRQRLGHRSIASTGEYLKESDSDVDAVIVNSVGL